MNNQKTGPLKQRALDTLEVLEKQAQGHHYESNLYDNENIIVSNSGTFLDEADAIRWAHRISREYGDF